MGHQGSRLRHFLPIFENEGLVDFFDFEWVDMVDITLEELVPLITSVSPFLVSCILLLFQSSMFCKNNLYFFQVLPSGLHESLLVSLQLNICIVSPLHFIAGPH